MAGFIFCAAATIWCLRDVWRALENDDGPVYWLNLAEAMFCGVCAIIIWATIMSPPTAGS